MTDKQTPPDWAFERACSWVGRKPHHVRSMAVDNPERRAISALCDMIERYEQPPVDRKLLCAREAMAGTVLFDPVAIEGIVSRAIELWIEGYGE